VGRTVEIFDLLDGQETAGVPPDSMFVAEPNVISRKRAIVHANVRAAIYGDSADTLHRVSEIREFDLVIPLDRWVGLTVHLTMPVRDEDDLFVD
jgi:hypothetical protein